MKNELQNTLQSNMSTSGNQFGTIQIEHRTAPYLQYLLINGYFESRIVRTVMVTLELMFIKGKITKSVMNSALLKTCLAMKTGKLLKFGFIICEMKEITG